MSRCACRGWDLRCCQCGRFINHVGDSSAFHGGSTDIEPPDDDFYCDKCAAYNMSWAIAHPAEVVSTCQAFWHKPSHVAVAKSILRHKKHQREPKLPPPTDKIEKLMIEAGYCLLG